MRLYAKVTLVLFALIAVSIVLNFAVFRLYLSQNFAQIENDLVIRNVDRCRSAVRREIEYLATLARDWAQWDDSYEYMASHSREYEDANLDLNAFRDNQLSLVQFYDRGGKLAWGRAVDLESGQDITLDRFSKGFLPASSPLRNPHQPGNSTAGLVLTERGPMLVAASAILTTGGEGPARGVLILGRFLDGAMLKKLGEQVDGLLKVWPVEEDLVPEEEWTRLRKLPPAGGAELVFVDASQVLAYTVFSDLDGTPALLMRLGIPRDVSERGRGVAYFAALSIAVVGLLILLTMIRMLQHLIVEPVGELTRGVLEARKSGTAQLPLSLARDDELGTLFREFEGTVKEWEQAKRQAERTSQAKSEFLSTVSHELKTPLNSIVGLAELIAKCGSPETCHEHAHKIISESESLVDLINEILDNARIEAGKLDIENVPFSLPRLLSEVVSVMRVHAEQKGLAFNLVEDEHIPMNLMGDPFRIRQVLMNLLSNAIKFTDQGSVTLTVKTRALSSEEVLAYLAVQDTGAGIPDEKKPKIFQRYISSDETTPRKFGSTGLGTAIASDLVKMMGGDIGFESELGKGSTFWFKLRLKQSEAVATAEGRKTQPGDKPPAPRSGHILLVEDYLLSQQVLSAHLRSAGYDVEIARTGKEAVDLAARARYDLILMDVRVPELNGYEATKRIRAGGSVNARTPVLAMTAYASDSARRECLEAGMNDFVTKPIRGSTLLAMADKWILGGGGPAEPAPGAQPPRPRSAEETRPPLDWDRAVREFRGEAELVDSLLTTFLQTVRDQLVRMESALKNDDFEVIRSEAHAIKGGAGNLTADNLGAVAGRLEVLAQASKSRGCELALQVFRQELEELEAFVKKLRSARPASGGGS